MNARRNALGSAWKLEDWKGAVKPEEWPKVVYVLNRGGRFEGPGDEYEGEWIKYRFGAECTFYDEGAAAARDSYSGAYFDGLPRLEPVRFSDGKPVQDDLPLVLVNWKSRYEGTYRTINAAWLREVRGQNPLWMNPLDASARGLQTGDRIRVRSATGQVEGVVLVTEGIRPGVVGADRSYGHQEYAARQVEIDGKPFGPAPAYGHTPFNLSPVGKEKSGYATGRGEGFLVNHVVRADARLVDSPITDPIGGGASELDTRVEVEKVLDGESA